MSRDAKRRHRPRRISRNRCLMCKWGKSGIFRQPTRQEMRVVPSEPQPLYDRSGIHIPFDLG